MRVSVLIPTHNRAVLLRRALESLLAADQPAGLDVDVTVIDNRSTDDTRALVESFMPRFGGRLHYLYESTPGRSHALNAGVAATRGDLVAMIDDDEEVDRGWLMTIAVAFREPTTDFIGGPYLPQWGAPRPNWIGSSYRSAIGWSECGEAIRQFGQPGFDGMLMGGNAVMRRSMLERVGAYAADLGRTPGGRLLGCEDDDMFARLLEAGARGFYRPDLVIHHFVAPERLTKRYFRRWCFWRSVSFGILDRRKPAPVKHLLGVPRYLIGLAVRGALDSARLLFDGGDPARTFANELAWWDLAGFFYGKHLYRIEEFARAMRVRIAARERRMVRAAAVPVAVSDSRGNAPIAGNHRP